MKTVEKERDNTDVAIGRKLRELRSIRGLNQEDLGKYINVSYQQVQKYETGINRLSAKNLFKIARAFDVPVSYFFEESDTANEESEYQKELQKFITAYGKIKNKDIREKILKFMRSFSSE